MSLKRKVTNYISALTLAFSSVENNILGQKTETLNNGNTPQERKQTTNDLTQALINGEVNEEVRNLRWRMYKVLQSSQGIKTRFQKIGDSNYEKVVLDNKKALSHIKLDSFDSYPLEMVIDNTPVTLSINDAFDKADFTLTSLEHMTKLKNETPISIKREYLPKFELENYTTKMKIRIIDKDTRLLEFYVEKYSNPENRLSGLFLSEVKKIMQGKPSTITEINQVDFITNKNIGVDDFLSFSYEILAFDKIIEFDGNYVLKFKAKVIKNGENILEQFREKDLDEKYDKKEMRKHTI